MIKYNVFIALALHFLTINIDEFTIFFFTESSDSIYVQVKDRIVISNGFSLIIGR